MQSRRWIRFIALLSFAYATSAVVSAQSAPITLSVDASEAQRRIFHAHLTVPVSPGPFTLLYPKWLPGNHRPTGPINNLVGLKMTAAGRPLAWRRDDVDMYEFHCEVPRGDGTLEVWFDYVTPSHGPGRFDPVSTDQFMILNWNVVLLYPQGKPATDYTYKASLRLPSAWKFGTALPIENQSSDNVNFVPVSLVTLIDSPLLAGAHYRAVPLPAPGTPPQEIDMAADSDEALQASPALIQNYKRLMAEAAALFGAHHYRDYHFLLSLSDLENGSGLEHHESSDNRVQERSLIDADRRKLMAGLLPHEFVHSWNGKYRRPVGLFTPDYQQPMKGELLWIYEGLTEYLGEVLMARSGLATPEQFREGLALTAANMDHHAGRIWRPLEDTAVSAQLLYEAPPEWTSWRRSADFYPESVLIWLEADTIIRNQTRGKHSLDDFCRAFFGPPSGPPTVKPYVLDDVIAALNLVAAYDWKSFFGDRVNAITPRAPKGGIQQGGWMLVYNQQQNELRQAAEKTYHFFDLTDSLGVVLRKSENEREATIADVVPGMPAAQAGIAPGMTLLAINGRRWSPEVLKDALRNTQKPGAGKLELVVENVGFYKTLVVNYEGGPQSPHLVRIGSQPDLLGDIIKPRAPGPQ